MHVAVCIVSYRGARDVAGCLAALAGSQHQAFEVVICENGGEAAFRDLTAAIPEQLAGGQPVRAVLAPGNLGYAGGVNRCLAEAPDAEAWWVLNPDTRPYPGALAAMVERLGRGDCAAVGGPLELPNGKVQSYGGRWRPWLARAVSLGYGETIGPAPPEAAVEARQNYLNGASMLMGRRFLQAVGPMREDYFLYCEEVEWCLRGLRAGLTLGFAPEGRVEHEQGTSTGNAPDLSERSRLSVRLNERNRLLLTRDLYPARLPVAALAALGLLVLRYGRARAWKQLGYALDGWVAGLAGERGTGPH